MIQNFKILGQTVPTANTETLNYTVPTNTFTTVRSINITNISTNADTYTISIVPIAANSAVNSNYIVYNNTIAGRSTVSIKAGHTLSVGAGIRVVSVNGTSTFSTYGVEMT